LAREQKIDPQKMTKFEGKNNWHKKNKFEGNIIGLKFLFIFF